MTSRTLVTGAGGFIGQAVVQALAQQGIAGVRAWRRAPARGAPEGWRDINVGSVNANTDWSAALRDVDTVIHLAARVHVMHETLPNPLTRFTEVNVTGTTRLAQEAASAGARRLIYMSTIKVLGETTDGRGPFTEQDELNPRDHYATSKARAEKELQAVAGSAGLEYVIVRAPLVYGPNVKGNFPVMMDWVERGLPLPLGSVDNQRTLLGLDNLIDLLCICRQHPEAANQIFHAGDSEDVSTTELLRRLGNAVGKPARLVPVPRFLLASLARVAGKTDLSRRLLGSLQVDTGKARQVLGWQANVPMEDQLARMISS